MSDIESSNSQCFLKAAQPLHGMIDAHACHSSRATWPDGLVYVKSTGETVPLKEIVERIPRNMRMKHSVDCSGLRNSYSWRDVF